MQLLNRCDLSSQPTTCGQPYTDNLALQFDAEAMCERKIMDPLQIAKSATPIIERIIAAASGPVKARLALWSNQLLMHDFSNTLKQITEIRTIWTRFNNASIYDFYYPTKLVFPAGIREVATLEHLEGCCIVEGVVGQGKSILMRYLFAEGLKNLGKLGKIPVLVTLRRIGQENSNSIRQLICRSARESGLEMDDEILSVYLSTNSIFLLLDGFDEVRQDAVASLISDIELICREFPSAKIIISTRPGAISSALAWFKILPIVPLTEADAIPFFQRICQTTEAANLVGEILLAAPKVFDLKSLLTTPLLLTLFAMVATAEGRAPQSKSDFYQELFYLYFQRHDDSKPGFIRHHPLGMGYSQSRAAFDAFSFQARRSEWISLSRKSLEKCVEFAARSISKEIDSEQFRREFTRVTPLLQEDGSNTNFLHKSVAEYHSASHIASLSDEFAKRFYIACKQEAVAAKFAVELDFLEELDPNRYAIYYLNPRLIEFLKEIPGELDIKTPIIVEYIKRFGLPFEWSVDGAVTGHQVLRLFAKALHSAFKEYEAKDGVEYRNAIQQIKERAMKEFSPRGANYEDFLSQHTICKSTVIIFQEAVDHIRDMLRRSEARLTQEQELWIWTQTLDSNTDISP
jgi:hypothetical protein